MWDRPAAMNRLAGLLLAATVVALLCAALYRLVQLPLFALHELHLTSAPGHVTRGQIETIAARALRGNFFTLDLGAARAAFETLPWVRKVDMRRRWPDRLELTLEEHVPLARWGTAALVNTHGEVFESAYEGALPVFVGPPGSAKEIAIQFDYFRRMLETIGQQPAQVQVSARRAWQLRLESGLTIELGRDDIEKRLSKFVAAYERTVGRMHQRLDYVDLRYGNGFAVRLPEAAKPGTRGRG